MSWEALTWMFDSSDTKANTRLVMISLCKWANPIGDSEPGVPIIAKEANISERSVQRITKRLEKAGDIKILAGQGYHTSNGKTNRYQLLDFIQHLKDTGKWELAMTSVGKRTRKRGDSRVTPSANGVTPKSPPGVTLESPQAVTPGSHPNGIEGDSNGLLGAALEIIQKLHKNPHTSKVLNLFMDSFQLVLTADHATRLAALAEKAPLVWFEEAIESYKDGAEPIEHVERAIRQRLAKAKRKRQAPTAGPQQRKTGDSRYAKVGR